MTIPKSDITDKPFSERLEYGREAENEALQLVQSNYDGAAFLIDGLDKAKDIVSPKTGNWFEVKDQRNAVKCLAVEFCRRAPGGAWRPSAIATTKADFWIWHTKGVYIVIETWLLFAIAKTKPITVKPHRGEEYAFKVVTIEEVREASDFVWTKTESGVQ